MRKPTFDVHKHVPWYLPLLVDQVLRASDDLDLRRRLRSVLPELKEQAWGYWDSLAPYTKTSTATEFGLHLHGGLDLLGDTGTCRELRCRLAASNRLIRSVGVFADVVWISDTVTWSLLDFGRATNIKLHALAEDALVLANIYPLIAAGVVRFRPSALLSCKACAGHLQQQVEDAVDLVYPIFSEAMSFRKKDGIIHVDTGGAYDPPLFVAFQEDQVSDTEDFLKVALRRDLRSALFVAQETQLLGGALFSNSRVALSGMFALRHSSERNRADIKRAMSDEDGLEFPWISELSAHQVVELRAEASGALPAFREAMATALSVGSDGMVAPDAANARIAELREHR